MIRLQRLTLLVEVTNKLSRVGGGGWVDQVGLKLTQSPTGVGVEVGTELGNKLILITSFAVLVSNTFKVINHFCI